MIGKRDKYRPTASESIEVPKWVPPRMELDYLAIAERDGEEAATSMIRRRKRAAALAPSMEATP